MPIANTDIKCKYATAAGSAGNSNSGTANSSLGKYISTTEVVDATLNALFDDVSGTENAALDTEYRCVFVHNAHATLTLVAPVLWIPSQVADGTNVTVGLDPTAPSAIGSSSAQSVVSATEQDAPAGVTFSAPADKASGIALPSIPAGQCVAIWFKRVAQNTDAMNADGVSWRIEGDTGA